MNLTIEDNGWKDAIQHYIVKFYCFDSSYMKIRGGQSIYLDVIMKNPPSQNNNSKDELC